MSSEKAQGSFHFRLTDDVDLTHRKRADYETINDAMSVQDQSYRNEMKKRSSANVCLVHCV